MGHVKPPADTSFILADKGINTVSYYRACRICGEAVGKDRVLSFDTFFADTLYFQIPDQAVAYLQGIGKTAWESSSYYPFRDIVSQCKTRIIYT